MIEYKDFLTCVVIKTEIPIKRVYEEQNSHRYEFCEKKRQESCSWDMTSINRND